ncbi:MULTISPECIES: hypothetical protein [unclassified Clostridioides]|uniref:hypothetical protein n=1 Tax=unclassified Clostridioides TaxID=2635829 RepID=UPI0007BC3444|nr:hypothetical protein CDFC105_64243 [Clostridioides difficile]CZS01669.1 hypothetical protein CDFC105_70661 [Clostridioides difficile]
MYQKIILPTLIREVNIVSTYSKGRYFFIQKIKVSDNLGIDIHLKNGKEKIDFHFPVNPQDSLSIKKEKRFETVDIVNLGEFDIKK